MREYNHQQQLISDYYELHRAELVNYVRMRLSNTEESEDVVQDAFIKMLAYRQLINETTLKSFVFRIVQNIVRDHLRHRLICQAADREMAHALHSMEHCDAERATRVNELRQLLRQGIDHLSPSCCKVYTLSLFDGLKADEIAQRCGVSKRTIEAQLLTSRKTVRRYMAQRMNA